MLWEAKPIAHMKGQCCSGSPGWNEQSQVVPPKSVLNKDVTLSSIFQEKDTAFLIVYLTERWKA